MTTIFDRYRRGMAVLGEDSYEGAEGEAEGEGEEYAEGEEEGEEESEEGEEGEEGGYGYGGYGGGGYEGGEGEGEGGGGGEESGYGESEQEAPAGESEAPPSGGSGGGSAGGEGEGEGGGGSGSGPDPNAGDDNNLNQVINDATAASEVAASYINTVIDVSPMGGRNPGLFGDTIIGLSETTATTAANRAVTKGQAAINFGQLVLKKKGGKNKAKAQRAITIGKKAISAGNKLHDHVKAAKAKSKIKPKNLAQGATAKTAAALHTPGLPHGGAVRAPGGKTVLPRATVHKTSVLPKATAKTALRTPIKTIAKSILPVKTAVKMPVKTTTMLHPLTTLKAPIKKTGLYGSLVARGREKLAEQGSALTSAIPGVSDEAWTKFVRVMRTAEPKAISASNAVGMFEMMPRRLSDLGLVENLARKKLPSGRVGWVFAFVPPLTAEQFLGSSLVQYRVFCDSMRDYVRRIDSGEIEIPAGMSLSGALAVLHRAGPEGLRPGGEQFPATKALYARAKDIF